jgi:predicted component of viral defense system (DUF524 family)
MDQELKNFLRTCVDEYMEDKKDSMKIDSCSIAKYIGNQNITIIGTHEQGSKLYSGDISSISIEGVLSVILKTSYGNKRDERTKFKFYNIKFKYNKENKCFEMLSHGSFNPW